MTDNAKIALPPTEFITEPVRLSFPSLFVPRANAMSDSKKETYQMQALIPPKVSLDPWHAALKAALIAFHGDEWKAVAKRMKEDGKWPIHDATKKDYDGYDEGWHYVNLNSNFPVAVVDRGKKPILVVESMLGKTEAEQKRAIAAAESVIYAGCYVQVHVNAFGWKNKLGGKGASFGFKAVRFWDDGQPFGGKRNTADAFEDLDDVSGGKSSSLFDDDDDSSGDDDDFLG